MKPLETLVSMIDFVFHLRNMTTSELCKTYPKNFKTLVWNGNQSDMVKDMLAIDAIQWKLTGEYAKFLRQPLTLGMFVPVSEAGEVLEDPNINDFKSEPFCTTGDCKAYRDELDIYNKAKSRCLFEGFEVEYSGTSLMTVTNGKFGFDFYHHKNRIQFEFSDRTLTDINSIAFYDLGLTLTPYAKELIYGN